MNYYMYPKILFGESDIACLTMRSGLRLENLKMGSDGSYKAYIVDEYARIGSHYTEVWQGETWLSVFDDSELIFEYHDYGSKFKVFRAGERGVVIQLFLKNKALEDVLGNKFLL